MASPLATEKIVRAILKTLVKGGYLANYSTLETIPVNASDAAIDNVVNLLIFGAIPITGVSTPDIISDTDVTAWCDADLTTGNHTNYFRVGTRGTTTAMLTKHTECATVGRSYVGFGPISSSTSLTVGPRIGLLDNTDTTGYSGIINLGGYFSGSTYYYGTVIGGSDALLVDRGAGTGGFSINTRANAELRASSYITVMDSISSAVRGGFYGLDTNAAALFVGEYPTTVANNALLLRKVTGTRHFEAHLNTALGSTILFVNSSNTTSYSACMAVAGVDGVPQRDPASHSYPALSVFGTDLGDTTVGLFKATQGGGGVYNGNIVRVIQNSIGHAGFNFIWCGNYTGPGIDQYTGVFRVNGAGAVWGGGAYTTPYADLAEWMLTDAPHDPGSVLVMRNGIAVLSDEYEAAGVVGVVSSQPGLVMNGMCEGKENHCRIAESGMVPVFFSTEFGDVEGNGELLCAGPGGYAVRAPEHPRPGSIVGKAMSAMSSYQGDAVCGVIQMLVC
jgi:hypothetical protein